MSAHSVQQSTTWRNYRQLVTRYLLPQKFSVILLGVLLFSSIGLQLVNPQLMSYFIDTAQKNGPLQSLLWAALSYLGISILQQIIYVTSTYFGENIGWTATNALREELVAHCMQLDMSFHNQKTPGEMIERIDGDVTSLSNVFSKFIFNFIGNLLLLIGVLIALSRVDWRASVPFTIFVVVVAIVITLLQKVIVPKWVASRQASAEYFGFLEERIQGIEDVQANGAQGYVIRSFLSVMRGRIQQDRKAIMANALAWSTTSVLFLLGNALALSIGYYLFGRHSVSLGTVYLIFFYTEMLRTPLERLTSQMSDLQQASASVKRIGELMNLESKIHDGPGTEIPHTVPTLEYRNVTFGYSEDELMLENVSFTLPAGQVLGVIGRTGSGKTTLGRLLFRLYNLNDGQILLNGTDISQARLQELRSRIGMVTQDVQLFQASIRDNLTFFDDTISDAEVRDVLHELGMSEWLDSMSDGLNTELQSGGSGLSAGQAQLLALARVFLRNPDLVVLDEASSRLDPSTEQTVERAMNKLLQNRTAIIIAHRLSTIERADQILVLEQGKVREYGPRVELANDPNSRLYEMLHLGMEVEVV